jgi:2-haloacid dehalogenase
MRSAEILAHRPRRLKPKRSDMNPPRPILITFDIFGTVLDWRRGLREALADLGHELSDSEFDLVIDAQAHIEEGPFTPYAEVVARSLREVLKLPADEARAIGEGAGRWPLYPDSRAALARLLKVAPCAATTNSDIRHGEDVVKQLGFPLSGWISAEEIRRYKPDVGFWEEAGKRMGTMIGRGWWHVSAYGDYDLEAARWLGLTCVFIDRPHARHGPNDINFPDLAALADYAEGLAAQP